MLKNKTGAIEEVGDLFESWSEKLTIILTIEISVHKHLFII